LLSEDAGFGRAVEAAGARFVGPSESVLATFGDKLQARSLAASLGIPSPPGTPQAIDPGAPEVLRATAAQLGYPVLVKAAGGGGGIGMQPVFEAGALDAAVTSCSARGQAAFGDARVYLEKYMLRPRHLEVQVLATGLSRARAVGDRECSVQRRHQKIIEEAPAAAPLLTDALRTELHASAERLIGAGDYRGAATVEFIVDAQADSPVLYFLEVNARLQVEHPVTELTTGLDLVEWQLRIAAGEEGLPPRTPPRGHAIEARLCAEDPARGFVPQPGSLAELHFPDLEDCRIDAGYETGDVVSAHYDSLIAKVVAWGPDREAARGRLLHALKGTRVQLQGPKGPRATNLDFLQTLLQSQAFASADYDTQLTSELTQRG
jgi:acetyl/propionyl-CoA carboxylase alpha subunit